MKIPTDGRIYAGGGILWREISGKLHLAVVHRPKYDDWSLPKGKVDRSDDNSLEETALREVAEETGWKPTLMEYVGEVRYLKKGREKSVHYWNMITAEAEGTPEPEEVDRLDWLSIDEASKILTYDHERKILEKGVGIMIEKERMNPPK